MKNLLGTWKATENITADLGFTQLGFDDSSWSDIEVPSHWQTNPAFEHYPEKLIYRHRFIYASPVDCRRYFLRFDGVFYFCRAWLNGVYLGEHTGYFDPFEFEVTSCLREGENVLSVFVRCERERNLNRKRQALGVFANWDCKPDLIQPGGIWNNVSLLDKDAISIKKLNVGDIIFEDNDASCTARVIFRPVSAGTAKNIRMRWKIIPDNFETESICPDGEFLFEESAINADEHCFTFTISNPLLWWPRDYGAQHLYRLEISVLREETIIDSASVRFGVRTIEMKNWKLHVNGRPIFCRGSNYAPCDIRISSATRDHYLSDVEQMANANLNIIRVHAHVEKSEFYDVCDENGMLIWQDFPLQWYYAREVVNPALEQAAAMANMLMSHPSIAIWCCHNEPNKSIPTRLEAEDLFNTAKIQEFITGVSSAWGPKNWNRDILDRKLQEAIIEIDGSRPVIPYSGIMPPFGEGHDTHLYFGWYVATMRMLKSFGTANHKMIRFVTEYGAQAFPSIETFKKIQNVNSIKEIDWNELGTRYMHQRPMMEKYVPLREDQSLEEYIEASQEYQARLIKYYNEFLRSRKYRPCNGAIHFMFNDCCPSITWSVLDYFRKPKKGFEALKDSFRPLHIMMEFPKLSYRRGVSLAFRIFVVNDLYKKHTDAIARWAIVGDDGNRFAEGSRNIEIPEDSIIRAGSVRWRTNNVQAGFYTVKLELLTGESSPLIENSYRIELK